MADARMLTRSNFVKGGLVAIGAGALGSVVANQPAAYAAEVADAVAWDKEADIVVIGCGAGGMVAALEAVDEGASVIVVEKNASCGGNAFYSHGVVMGNMSRMDTELGIEITNEEILEEAENGWYLMDQPDQTVSEIAVAEAGTTLDWLLDHGVVFDNPEGNYNPTYSDLPIYHQIEGWGTGLSVLTDQVAEKADELLLNTRATQLVQDAEGRVVGVVCDADGEQIAIRAQCGVILASGGFCHNNALYTLWDHRTEGMLAQGSPANTGDGLIMAAACGAAYMSGRSESPTSCLLDMNSINYVSFAISRDGGICVGVDGKRFMLESSELVRVNTDMAIEQYMNTKELGSDYVCFVCTDCDAIQTSIADGVVVFEDETLEGLAGQLGIDPDGLVAEVAHYNEMASKGVDEDFGKVEGLIPLESGPFYGVQVTPRLNQSSGGLLINEKSQVQSYQLYAEDGAATASIPGLYAAGEIIPYSVHYGYALSRSFTEARIAVQDALANGK